MIICFNLSVRADIIEGKNYLNPSDTWSGQAGLVPKTLNDRRVGAFPVFMVNSATDTTYLTPPARIFDNQEFIYVNNATNTDSVAIAIQKIGEIKVFEGDNYLLSIIRHGVNGDTATGDKRDGKIRQIIYTKP